MTYQSAVEKPQWTVMRTKRNLIQDYQQEFSSNKIATWKILDNIVKVVKKHPEIKQEILNYNE